MTSLQQTLKDDLTAAMKAGKKDETEVMRTLLSDARNLAIQEGTDRDVIEDDLMLRVLRKGVKSRNESVELYTQGERQDLVDVENFQIEVLKRYLPQEVAPAEIEVVVDTVIVEMGAEDKSSMGPVIKEVITRLEGRADGKTVSGIVAKRLS